MERVFLVGMRLFRDGEGKVSPNSYFIEDEMASNYAKGERSNCQFCEQTFQVASTGVFTIKKHDIQESVSLVIWLHQVTSLITSFSWRLT
jgi:hypothetical protein